MPKIAMIITIALLFARTADAQAVPNWLAGYWLSCETKEQVSETWVSGSTQVMLGSGITMSGGKVNFELMRIGKGTNSGLSFFASPDGAPPTEFALKSQDATRVVFENLAHDFPQRVIYASDGKNLTARIEGKMNGRDQAMDWRYAPGALNTQCPAK